MKDSNSKRKFQPVFIMAAFVGLIFAGIMLAINLYIDDHGAENGEHNWMSSFLITQGIPFYFFLQLLHLVGLGTISNATILTILASVADGLAIFLFLLILGSVWQLVVKVAQHNKS